MSALSGCDLAGAHVPASGLGPPRLLPVEAFVAPPAAGADTDDAAQLAARGDALKARAAAR